MCGILPAHSISLYIDKTLAMRRRKRLRFFTDFAAKKGRLRRSIGERASCPAGVPLHIGSSAGLEARAPAEKPSVTNIANSFAMYVS